MWEQTLHKMNMKHVNRCSNKPYWCEHNFKYLPYDPRSHILEQDNISNGKSKNCDFKLRILRLASQAVQITN